MGQRTESCYVGPLATRVKMRRMLIGAGLTVDGSPPAPIGSGTIVRHQALRQTSE